jgi:hypothetical protein
MWCSTTYRVGARNWTECSALRHWQNTNERYCTFCTRVLLPPTQIHFWESLQALEACRPVEAALIWRSLWSTAEMVQIGADCSACAWLYGGAGRVSCGVRRLGARCWLVCWAECLRRHRNWRISDVIRDSEISLLQDCWLMTPCVLVGNH